jgi:PPE-repeat protein
MDFATLPPEINSARMYSGPGPGSLIRAAEAWEALAAQLRTAAARSGGPAQGYLDWLARAAATAELAAVHAAAGARAHRSALAATVPPPVIAANRAQRTLLARRNCLGQAGPVLAEMDAEYERMWARDADAMYAYARASADAVAMTPFSSPPTGPARAAAATWALKSAPEVIAAGSDVMSIIPLALQALSASPLASFDAALAPATASLSRLSALSAPSGVAITHLNSLNKAAALSALLPKRRAALTARRGGGASIGELSVPPAWSTATAPLPVWRGTVA